jgi:hypothetical protein
MCLIVDINIAHRVFRKEDPEFGPVHNALFSPKRIAAKLIYGGRLRREYAASESLRRIVAQLDRAGRALASNDALIDSEEQALIDQNACGSDDPHIIALARVTGTRLLCSHDQALHADFTDSGLINSPRGNVYQTPAHQHLIRRHCS